MQRYVLHSHKLYSIKIIHNFYQNLSWVPCCIYFLGVNSGKSRSRQHALNGRLCCGERNPSLTYDIRYNIYCFIDIEITGRRSLVA